MASDHERGCQGREYTCTCGYDDRIADRITELEARLEASQESLADQLEARKEQADRITELEADNAKLKAMQEDDSELLTIAYMDGSHRSTKAHRAKIAQQDAVIAGLRLDIEAQEALQVSAYHAGMKLGWNCAVTDDREKYDQAIAGTEHVKELHRIRKARQALAKAKESRDD